MQNFKTMDVIVEVGPNDKLSKMLKRAWPDKKIVSINTPSDIEELVKVIKNTKPQQSYFQKEQDCLC